MQFDPSTYTDPERLGNEWSKEEILETCEKIKNDTAKSKTDYKVLLGYCLEAS